MYFNKLDDYIDNLQQELERNTSELLERSKNIIATTNNSSVSQSTCNNNSKDSEPSHASDNSYHLEKLHLHNALEESTKSRIGTFHKIYDEIFVPETGIPISSFGYNDLDYSALVSLLSCALETELNHSIYKLIKRQFISSAAKPNNEINIKGKTIELTKTSQTLGAMAILIAGFKQELAQQIHDIDDFLSIFNRIVEYRNRASHSTGIDKKSFFGFYENFSKLFNAHIEELMRIKISIQATSFSAFSITNENNILDADEQSYLDSILNDDQSQSSATQNTPKSTHNIQQHPHQSTTYGIIFTDCSKLAIKYYGAVNDTVATSDNGQCIGIADIIRNTIHQYIEDYKEFGVTYYLFDVSIEKETDWKTYYNALIQYYHQIGLNTLQSPCSLFILGGNDVIPMPQVHNPTYDIIHEKEQKNITEKYIDTDILYAYPDADAAVDNKLDINLERLFNNQPIFFVGRLPLEDGFMESDFISDIKGYFTRSIDAVRHNGIQLESMPVLTSCESSKKIAQIMTSDIPLHQLNNVNGYIENNIIISPLYELPNAIPDMSSGNISDSKANVCLQEQMSAGMLLFILHGSPQPLCPEYSGERDATYRPTAFHPDLFKFCKAQCIAGVCCYGAKFIGYKRQLSPLLQAIYNNALLFMGSCRSAYGHFDIHLNLPEVKQPLTASEILLKYYTDNILAGIPAGEALLAAKIQYITYAIHNQDAEPADILTATIMEFNLFGDPTLKINSSVTHAQTEQIRSIFSTPHHIPSNLTELRSYTDIFNNDTRDDYSQYDTSSQIQKLVDNNLLEIHNILTNKLYKELGLPPRELYCFKRYNTTSGAHGYTMCYKNDDKRFNNETRIDLDIQGNIRSIVSTL